MKDARPDNRLLLAVAKQRDQAAFLELFNRYGKNANALAYHITGDRNLAEEATQEGLLNVWNSAHTFRSDGVAKKWILCVVANAANQVLRTRNREAARIQKRAALEPPKSNTNDSHVERDEREEMLDVLRLHTLRLPPKDRQLLTLYYGAGLNQSDIGEMLSVPQRTVSHRLKEALEVLREHLRRAGYSGVLALFTDELYCESLLSSVSLYPHASKKLMDAVNQTQSQDAGASVEKDLAFWRAFPGLIILISCCVLASSAIYALSGYKNQQRTSVEPSEVGAPTLMEEVTVQRVPFSETWIFDSENRPDIPILRGQWQDWVPASGKRPSGALSGIGSNNAIWIKLPIKIQMQPFVIHVSLRSPGRKMKLKHGFNSAGVSGFLSTTETKDGIQMRWFLKRDARFSRGSGHAFVESIYFKGCYQVHLSNDYHVPSKVTKYKDHAPNVEFRLGVHGYVVERITIQSYTDEAFPIDAKKWESFTVNADSQSQLRRLIPRPLGN